MKKGDIFKIEKVIKEQTGYVVQTDGGHVLGIIKLDHVSEGDLMQIGPVCGDWCKVFVQGDQYRAQILQEAPDKATS